MVLSFAAQAPPSHSPHLSLWAAPTLALPWYRLLFIRGPFRPPEGELGEPGLLNKLPGEREAFSLLALSHGLCRNQHFVRTAQEGLSQ